MKAISGFGGAMLMAALAFSACGRLKDDSARKDPKLGPAPDAPVLDTAPAPADHSAAPANTGSPDIAAKAPDSAARTPDTAGIGRERQFANIRELAADKFSGCDSPVLCNGLAYFDCAAKGVGAGYYYDTSTVALVSRCGAPCANPDEAQKKVCETLCPPPAWNGCPGT